VKSNCFPVLNITFIHRSAPTAPPSCNASSGNILVNVETVSYDNPNKVLFDGTRCDGANGDCRVVVDLCISHVGKRWMSITLWNLSFHQMKTYHIWMELWNIINTKQILKFRCVTIVYYVKQHICVNFVFQNIKKIQNYLAIACLRILTTWC